MVEANEVPIEERSQAGETPRQVIESFVTSEEDNVEAMITYDRAVRVLKAAAVTSSAHSTSEFWEKQLGKLSDIATEPDFDEANLDQVSMAADVFHYLQEQAIIREGNILKETMKQPEASTYEVFVNSEFLQQPISLQVDTFPPMWFKKLTSEKQHEIRVRIRLANGAFIKRQVADIDGDKAKENQYLTLTEREFALLYEGMPGVKETMEIYMKTLFESYQDNGANLLKIKNVEVLVKSINYKKKNDVYLATVIYPENEEDREIEVEKGTKVGDRVKTIDENILDSLNDFQTFQEKLIKQLSEDLDIEELDAKAAVAVAWNLLFIGNVVESADTERNVDPSGVYGEQIRAFMHPLVKALKKFKAFGDKREEDQLSVGTEEGWGGVIGDWITGRNIKDPVFAGKLRKREIKPFPERMFISFPELITVEAEVGKEKVKMSMAEALIEGHKIICKVSDSDLFGKYSDAWDSCWKAYNYAIGKVPLDFREGGKWVRELVDARAKIVGINTVGSDGKKTYPLRKYCQSPEFHLWVLANSIGLMSGTSEIILSLPFDDDAYDTVVDQLLKHPRLMPTREDREFVKKEVHAHGFVKGKIERTKIRWQATREASRER